MTARTRKLISRTREALRRAAHITRAAAAATLATSTAALIRRAAHTLTGFTAAQTAKAQELIEDGAIQWLRGRIYLAVSSDGTRIYRTATTGHCTCPDGLKASRQRPCYHVFAARALEVA